MISMQSPSLGCLLYDSSWRLCQIVGLPDFRAARSGNRELSHGSPLPPDPVRSSVPGKCLSELRLKSWNRTDFSPFIALTTGHNLKTLVHFQCSLAIYQILSLIQKKISITTALKMHHREVHLMKRNYDIMANAETWEAEKFLRTLYVSLYWHDEDCTTRSIELTAADNSTHITPRTTTPSPRSNLRS